MEIVDILSRLFLLPLLHIVGGFLFGMNLVSGNMLFRLAVSLHLSFVVPLLLIGKPRVLPLIKIIRVI